jgi:putative membrane protein insertion efficiency factor
MRDSEAGKKIGVGNQAAIACIGLVSGFFRVFGMRACRFSPSCSVYAREAFGTFGFFRAFSVTVKRLFRCHPFCDGGYDPLLKESWKNG